MFIKKVFVIGSGAMGSGIAHISAQNGFTVYLYDIDADRVRQAVQSIEKRLASSVAKGKLAEEEKTATIGRLEPKVSLTDASDCDLIIEAAAEDFAVKKEIFSQLNAICKKDAILASNTSSMSITAIASVLDRPENFIGLHFFNPVPVMKLLEITCGFCTSEETLEIARTFGEALGKEVITAKDGPGFIVNRMLDLMINEAAELLDQGYGSVEDIDKGMVYGCAHPMGPLTLADMAGIDILLAVMETFYAELGDSKYRPSPLVRKMVRAGYLGKKTGKGFYIYDEQGNKSPNPLLKSLNVR